MKKILILLLLSFGLISSSYAELDSEAYALRKLANNHLYGEGGYLKDPREAIILYKKYLKRVGEPTLENDSRNVMHTIAGLYLDYLNNSNEALIWYNKSAELGFFDAQLSLGKIYLEGKIVNKSLEKSAYWVRTAYENPSEYAQGTEYTSGNKHRAKYYWDEYELWKYYSSKQ